MKTLEQEIKQSKFKSPQEKAVVNLIYTAKIIEDEIKTILTQFSITNPQYNILRILNGSHPKPLNPGQIKDVMLFKGSDLTRLLDRLNSKGLIERTVCPSNRRSVEVLINQRGRNLLDKIRPQLDLIFKRLHNQLSGKESTELSNLLDKTRSSL